MLPGHVEHYTQMAPFVQQKMQEASFFLMNENSASNQPALGVTTLRRPFVAVRLDRAMKKPARLAQGRSAAEPAKDALVVAATAA